jgi:hypothetical protein
MQIEAARYTGDVKIAQAPSRRSRAPVLHLKTGAHLARKIEFPFQHKFFGQLDHTILARRCNKNYGG